MVNVPRRILQLVLSGSSIRGRTTGPRGDVGRRQNPHHTQDNSIVTAIAGRKLNPSLARAPPDGRRGICNFRVWGDRKRRELAGTRTTQRGNIS
jgi:hypothetical protein